MYLIKYVFAVLLFALSLLFVIRTTAATSLSTARGRFCRVVLSLLVLAFVGVVWYYSGERFFESKAIKIGARVISSVVYVLLLPDIWADCKTCPEQSGNTAGRTAGTDSGAASDTVKKADAGTILKSAGSAETGTEKDTYSGSENSTQPGSEGAGRE